jgi:DNA-binding response OmpR family regulator
MMTDVRTRILVAEDEPDLLLLVGATLGAAGYEVIETSDGDEALAATFAQSPALLLLDVMLPGRSGPEIAEALREAGVAAPIVMLSARGQADDIERGLAAGADHYLVKPFIPADLLRVVRAMLAGESPD